MIMTGDGLGGTRSRSYYWRQHMFEIDEQRRVMVNSYRDAYCHRHTLCRMWYVNLFTGTESFIQVRHTAGRELGHGFILSIINQCMTVSVISKNC